MIKFKHHLILSVTASALCLLSACAQEGSKTKISDKAKPNASEPADAINAKEIMDKVNSSIDTASNKQLEAFEAINLEDLYSNPEAFLAMNAKKPGVIVTQSGLQYRVIEQGDGNKPERDNKVEVHYRGTFPNGDEFDSSFKRGKPAQFPVTGVIKGWTEALLLMNEGSSYELVIPAELAYGKRGAGNIIPPNQVLRFEVKLLKADIEQ